MATTALQSNNTYARFLETNVRSRALESKALEKELVYQPAFETFKELKKYKAIATNPDSFGKAEEKIDPATVYRLENEFEHKKKDLTLSVKAIKANRSIGLMPPPPHMNPLNKAKRELEAYRAAFQQYRTLIIDNAPLWAKFTQEHQPVKERLSTEELKKTQSKAKKAFGIAEQNIEGRKTLVESIKARLGAACKYMIKP